MTTLKTAMLQFFFMQHKKPFLAILSVAAFVDGKPGSAFLETFQIKESGKTSAPPP